MASQLLQLTKLIEKEFKLEFRKRVSLASVLLFLVSASYICYKVFININGLAWISLFWIILLFASINLIQRTFNQNYVRRKWLYYSFYEPSTVYLSKFLYNLFFLVIIAFLLLFLMNTFFENFIKLPSLFVYGLILGTIGITGVMTFISSVVMHAENNGVLMSILAMPLTLPVILLAVKVHAVSFGLIQDTAVSGDLLLLGGIDLLIFGLGIMLFPNIWKA